MGLTRKVMVLFDPEQYEKIKEHAHLRGITVGSLIREAVEKELARSEMPDKNTKLEAARRLTSAQEETVEWDELERLLDRGHLS